MTQSIESHILGKQKLITKLNEVIPTLVENRNEELVRKKEDELDGLVEMMEIKNKIDFCLNRLENIVNAAPEEAERTAEQQGGTES